MTAEHESCIAGATSALQICCAPMLSRTSMPRAVPCLPRSLFFLRSFACLASGAHRPLSYLSRASLADLHLLLLSPALLAPFCALPAEIAPSSHSRATDLFAPPTESLAELSSIFKKAAYASLQSAADGLASPTMLRVLNYIPTSSRPASFLTALRSLRAVAGAGAAAEQQQQRGRQRGAKGAGRRPGGLCVESGRWP